jgi:fructose-bisphosphate aldolase class 1
MNGSSKKASPKRSTITRCRALVADDKGLLAMDESDATRNQRFARLEIPQTEEADVFAAQQAQYHRAKCNRAARRGDYNAAEDIHYANDSK